MVAIIGKGDATRIQTEDVDLIEKVEVQQNMIQLRKQSDVFKTQSIAKEKEIEQLKKEIAKLEIKEQMIQDQQTSIQNKNEEAKQEFVTSKAKYEDAV